MREGFEKLKSLLPGNKERGITKVALLYEAYEYLKKIQELSSKVISENLQLREELGSLRHKKRKLAQKVGRESPTNS